jgi:hypothetical protein
MSEAARKVAAERPSLPRIRGFEFGNSEAAVFRIKWRFSDGFRSKSAVT